MRELLLLVGLAAGAFLCLGILLPDLVRSRKAPSTREARRDEHDREEP